jgi:peptidyl-prolyl cis-trans isomerase-like protein 2
VKGKGYVTFATNLGDIRVELYCQDTPKTCYNLISLAKKGYYKNLKFHRNIKNFMLQGGDPTGTGSGGESIYGKPFEDELFSTLNHEGRGVLSMANRGPNTNTSQFFFTYRTCSHLNKKHTVFGKLVGGMDVLTRCELTPSGKNDVPLQDIILKDIIVHVDPFENVMTELHAKDDKEKQIRDRTEARLAKEKLVQTSRPPDNGSLEIGKYLKKRQVDSRQDSDGRPLKQKKVRGFDFSSW